MCRTRAFIRSAGMRHSASWRRNSAHSAIRNSPGRTNTRGASRKAQRAMNVPSYPSMARRRAPIFEGVEGLQKIWKAGLVESPEKDRASTGMRSIAFPEEDSAPKPRPIACPNWKVRSRDYQKFSCHCFFCRRSSLEAGLGGAARAGNEVRRNQSSFRT